MPVKLSSKKALRRDTRRRRINLRTLKSTKEAIKSFRDKPSKSLLSKAYGAIDQAVKKGVFHRTKGARLKSRLAGRLA